MKAQRLLATCGVASAAFAVSACGSPGGSAAQAAPLPLTATSQTLQIPTSTARPSPVPPPAGFPTATYAGFLESTSGAPGTLTLKSDGTYHIFGGPASDQLDIAGDYTVSGETITFQETVDAICSTPGTYTWRISGNTLQLTVVHDTCGGGDRSLDFAEHPWVKQP